MTDERISFRQARVLVRCPDRIGESQMETTCVVGGVELPGVRYGDAADDWRATERPCHDSVVINGELHVPEGDIERCPRCGAQPFGSDCEGSPA